MKFSAVEWDDGNWPKCGQHGVTKEEIDALVLSERFRYFPDPAHSADEDRWISMGRSVRTGHWMAVVFTVSGEDDAVRARPVSARYMHAKEVRRYVQDN